ncbi:hypothetical protein MHU86_17722 [Fragilaria crotonensis]|nr:hypothetical protein MHU86_17722 [Fragilaria crotonensis]
MPTPCRSPSGDKERGQRRDSDSASKRQAGTNGHLPRPRASGPDDEVRSYDCHSRTNPKINAVRTQDSDEPQHISSKSILRQLRMATTRRGGEAWPQASGIGTHSIRSGAAMAMHLAGVPSETIQMVGGGEARRS